jgi:two-component system alkaline phosphatase synthesis response regulator PhoP
MLQGMSQRILVVDDEPSVTDLIAYNLRKALYDVQVAADGRTALHLAREYRPDLILLDLMIPEMDGLDVCRELRKSSDVPVIMITARGEELDRVLGLEIGADDYVTKPFSMRELMARVKAVLRRPLRPLRAQKDGEAAPSILVRGPGSLLMDVERRSVVVGETSVELTRLEFDLLHRLLINPGRVLTRERLLEQAWGYEYVGDTRAVDSAVKRLRAKLRAVSDEADCIESVRGLGYRIN